MSTNPYQTPEGQLTTDDQSYGEINFFSPSSRINRLRYWAHGMLFALGFYAIAAVGGLLYAFVSPWIGVPIIAVAYIALIVFSVIVMIQRLHDLNKTGWLWLLALVPFANIYLLIILIFFKGTPGRNNYGLQTPPNKTWHWILALVFPVVILVVMIAVAVPAYNQYLEAMQQSTSTDYDQTESDSYPADAATDESAYPTEALEPADESVIDEGVVDDSMTEELEPVLDDAQESETPQ